MKKLLVFLAAISLVFGIVGSAGAAPLSPNETGVDLYGAVNLLLDTSYKLFHYKVHHEIILQLHRIVFLLLWI